MDARALRGAMFVLVLFRICFRGRIGRVKLEVRAETHGDGKLLKTVRGADLSRSLFHQANAGVDLVRREKLHIQNVPGKLVERLQFGSGDLGRPWSFKNAV